MKLEDLKAWIKGKRVVDWEDDMNDECGNRCESRIYESDGKLYRIEFCNNHPYEKWIVGEGYNRGDFTEPVEVIKKERTIIETYYEYTGRYI